VGKKTPAFSLTIGIYGTVWDIDVRLWVIQVGRREKISLTTLRIEGRRHWRFTIDTFEKTSETPQADTCNL
jgi:hypothetical protein